MSNRTALFQIQTIFSIPGRGEVLAGTLKEGMLFVGMKTRVNGNNAVVSSIESGHHEVPALMELGASAGICLTNIKKGDVSPGQLLSFGD